jgi:hypothetical protein
LPAEGRKRDECGVRRVQLAEYSVSAINVHRAIVRRAGWPQQHGFEKVYQFWNDRPVERDKRRRQDRLFWGNSNEASLTGRTQDMRAIEETPVLRPQIRKYRFKARATVTREIEIVFEKEQTLSVPALGFSQYC